MEPDDLDERPGRLSPDTLFIVWVMAATFLIIVAVIAADYLFQLLTQLLISR